MNRLRYLLTLFVLIASGQQSASAIEEGDTAPSWSAIDFDSRPVRFPEVIDRKPTVVIFWATWCAYCKAFMPYIGEIQADYGADNINILSINVQEDGELDPAAYLDELAYSMIAIQDGDPIAESFDVEFVPGLMVLDASGTVAFRRRPTEMVAGDTIANFWSRQVRRTLDRLLQ